METFAVECDCQRLDRYLRQKFGLLPQSALQKALRKRVIKVNGTAAEASTRVVTGDLLFIKKGFLLNFSSPKNPESGRSHQVNSKLMSLIESRVIYEDDNILAIDKPFGISVQAGCKVSESLDRALKMINPEYRVVHRLDKHTTGVLLFAKTLDASREMWRLFSNRLVKKKYLAIVVGELKKTKGEIDCYIKKALFNNEERMQCNDVGEGERAITHFRVVENFQSLSLVELFPLTGRKHQIRAQMASIGHPILNDGKYGRKQAFRGEVPSKKLMLHASEIEFDLYGKKIKVLAQLPEHFIGQIA